MIFPCIDLMDGKVVQLVQGRDKALEGDPPEVMLRRFAAAMRWALALEGRAPPSAIRQSRDDRRGGP